MINSVARRIYRGFLLTGLIYTICILLLVEFIYDEVEIALLSVGIDDEQEFYYQQSGGSFQTWQSTTVVATFVPDDLKPDEYNLPEVFRGLTPPFQNKIKHPDGYACIASVKKYPNGTLYISKDLSILEQMETAHHWYLYGFSVFLILLVFIFSRHLSKSLSKPLVDLAKRISRLEPGLYTNRLPDDYKDRELQDIALTMNKFLEALEDYIRREKSLINMASHELRTPIAVISGAVEVIENRGKLVEEDSVTLERIKKTTDEMRLNVEALLMLARGTLSSESYKLLPVKDIVQGCIMESMSADSNATKRIHFEVSDNADKVLADSALAHMLFRNLIENALKHTSGKIWISLREDRLILLDEGSGMRYEDQIKLMNRPDGMSAKAYSGLGLYIATLVCEHMGWTISVKNEESAGTQLNVIFHR